MKVFIIGVFDSDGSTTIFMSKAFKNLGHEVHEFNYRRILEQFGEEGMNYCLMYRAWECQPDLVIICKGNNVSPASIQFMNSFTQTWYWWMDPIITVEPQYLAIASECHHVSCTGGGVAQFFVNNGMRSVHHIFEGVDLEYYKPTEPDELFKADVSFIGSRTPERDNYIFSLGSQFPVRVYGPKYGTPVTGETFNKVCSSSKIMLSINSQNDIPDYFSDRVFLLLGAKSFVMQMYTPGLENYFENGKHIVWWKNLPELIDLCQYYVNEDTTEIREAGHQYVRENFTWQHSAQKILEVIGE